MNSFRKMLSMPGMLLSIHKIFSKIPDPRAFTTPPNISITDHLMSGLAVFGLKCPSLLDYDKKRAKETTAQNLRDLYLYMIIEFQCKVVVVLYKFVLFLSIESVRFGKFE